MTPTADPLQAFAHDLRELRRQAGNPGYRSLAARADYSASTLSEAAAGKRRPTLDVVLKYVEACGGDVGLWRARWMALDAAASGRTATEPAVTAIPIGGTAPEWNGAATPPEGGAISSAPVMPPVPAPDGTAVSIADGGRRSNADLRPSAMAGGRRPTRKILAAGGAALAVGAVAVAVAVRDEGGPVAPTRDADAYGTVAVLCNAGTQAIGVIHVHDRNYSLKDYDALLDSDRCTSKKPIEWPNVAGFYVGPGHCVDVRIDGSARGHRVKAGHWFWAETIGATYNLNASNC